MGIGAFAFYVVFKGFCGIKLNVTFVREEDGGTLLDYMALLEKLEDEG